MAALDGGDGADDSRRRGIVELEECGEAHFEWVGIFVAVVGLRQGIIMWVGVRAWRETERERSGSCDFLHRGDDSARPVRERD